MKKLLAILLVISMLASMMLLASCASMSDGDYMSPSPSYDGGYANKGESSNGAVPPADDGYFGSDDSAPSAPDGGEYGGSFGDSDLPEYDVSIDSEAIEGGASSDYGGASGDKGEATKPDQAVIPSGMITAGAWVDNDNYQMWLDLFAQGDGQTNSGKFYSYTQPHYSWGFNSLNRVKVSVTSGENAVAGATVVASDEQGNVLFSAVTDAQGNAYLFPEASTGNISVTSGNGSATAAFTADQREISVDLAECGAKLNVIEIMLVVDVTGSMGDEISFLKAELADVINKIAANNEDTVIKLAMLFYRDKTDSVPFDYYDFIDVTTAEGLATQQAALNKQSAKGGGDYPEAVDEALEMAVNQQWSTGATTKLIFHVLDAPAHNGAKYKEKLVNATKFAAENGIRICPIICSGAAVDAEYTMREAAIYTGGTFIYVTDDSGIGGSHHDPQLPNVTIELLNSLMVRLVNGYHTGNFEDPIYWKEDQNLNNR